MAKCIAANNSAKKSEIQSVKKENVKKEEEIVCESVKKESTAKSIKWNFLEHLGPVFAPPYEPLPNDVKFEYDNKPMKLSPETEEIATLYAKMLNRTCDNYTKNDVFNRNFMEDWLEVMSEDEKSKIKSLSMCNFKPMQDYLMSQSKKEKEKLKIQNKEIKAQYGFCMMDSKKMEIVNFKIGPPGLFCGRGDNPKSGKVKWRIMPEDVIINCSQDSEIPKPPANHEWNGVQHDNTVMWLARWNHKVTEDLEYTELSALSELMGNKDRKKYDNARRLHGFVDKIRQDYKADFSDTQMSVSQRAVALYFIDKLALRIGNEKRPNEADTVGCCSLRVEHIEFVDNNENVYEVQFDFLGKDSIKYKLKVEVLEEVYKNLKRFVEGKQPGDKLFDHLKTTHLNKCLKKYMPTLTSRVFRTYNACKTMEEELMKFEQDEKHDNEEKRLLYHKQANRTVAKLLNHKKAASKTFEKSMENLQKKIVKSCEKIKQSKQMIENLNKFKDKNKVKKIRKLENQLGKETKNLEKFEIQKSELEKNKEINLNTSKEIYIDPRISIAWCLRNNVPKERIYNKTLLKKFKWADITTKDFKFCDLDTDSSECKDEDEYSSESDQDGEDRSESDQDGEDRSESDQDGDAGREDAKRNIEHDENVKNED